MMLTKFFLDIIAWLYGEGVTPIYSVLAYIYIVCAIFVALRFGWKIKILGSIFLAWNFNFVYFLTFWSHSHRTLNCILFLKYGKMC